MAVFTPLSASDAQTVLDAHHLGTLLRVTPVPEGSVNSNFFVDSSAGRFFVRVYEEQAPEGVAYEWRLLDFLAEASLPVPRPLPGPPPGVVTVAGKPVGVFACASGESVCQSMVSEAKAARVGAFLGRAHVTCARFYEGATHEGRFTPVHMRQRLGHIEALLSERSLLTVDDLRADVARLRATLQEVEAVMDPAATNLPRGVIHADLFRDNVRWVGDEIAAVVDWESSSSGPLLYDLLVTLLAWCYNDGFVWPYARAMTQAYHRERPLDERELAMMRDVARYACVRFGITRLTDFELRSSVGERTHKDYRRFLQRLDALTNLSSDELAKRLGF